MQKSENDITSRECTILSSVLYGNHLYTVYKDKSWYFLSYSRHVFIFFKTSLIYFPVGIFSSVVPHIKTVYMHKEGLRDLEKEQFFEKRV